MEKIISVFNGSPRKNGNSAYTAQQIVELLKNYFSKSRLYHIADYNIEPCYGCRQCMQLKHCFNQKDEFEELFNAVRQSEVTIWIVPVYWYAPPGITKNFIDRTHGYFVKKGLLRGRKAHLINIATDSGFETNEMVMRSWLEWLGIDLIKVKNIYATEADDIKQNEMKIREIIQFTKDIIDDCK